MWQVLQKFLRDALESCVGAHTSPVFPLHQSQFLYLLKKYGDVHFLRPCFCFSARKKKIWRLFQQKEISLWDIFVNTSYISEKAMGPVQRVGKSPVCFLQLLVQSHLTQLPSSSWPWQVIWACWIINRKEQNSHLQRMPCVILR